MNSKAQTFKLQKGEQLAVAIKKTVKDSSVLIGSIDTGLFKGKAFFVEPIKNEADASYAPVLKMAESNDGLTYTISVLFTEKSKQSGTPKNYHLFKANIDADIKEELVLLLYYESWAELNTYCFERLLDDVKNSAKGELKIIADLDASYSCLPDDKNAMNAEVFKALKEQKFLK